MPSPRQRNEEKKGKCTLQLLFFFYFPFPAVFSLPFCSIAKTTASAATLRLPLS